MKHFANDVPKTRIDHRYNYYDLTSRRQHNGSMFCAFLAFSSPLINIT